MNDRRELPMPRAEAIGSDVDPVETREWLGSPRWVGRISGRDRARFLLRELDERSKKLGVSDASPYWPYRNSIALEDQPPYPGDLALEHRLTSIVRWNALIMVMRANQASGELGGHIASYASAAEIFEIGFNHFFRAPTPETSGDLVFYQPHSAPGIYARAFLEGRLSEQHLQNYRQEVDGKGLSS